MRFSLLFVAQPTKTSDESELKMNEKRIKPKKKKKQINKNRKTEPKTKEENFRLRNHSSCSKIEAKLQAKATRNEAILFLPHTLQLLVRQHIL